MPGPAELWPAAWRPFQALPTAQRIERHRAGPRPPPRLRKGSGLRRDDNDNRTTVNESNGIASSDRRYCYDARNQLVYRNSGAACSSSAKDEANTFDDAGNRLTALASGATTNFAYTADGQLCDIETAPNAASCSGGNVTYDTAGRTRSWNGWWFTYDSEGRLTSACKSSTCAAGSDKVEMTYDGEGHRTSLKTTSAAGAVATRDFRYQGAAIVEERLTDAAHPSGAVVRSYVTDESGGAVKLIVPAGESDAGTYLVTWNGHGDALALWRQNADGTLTLANSFTYDTWGRPTTATHNGVSDLGFRFLYVGRADVQWDDAFGLGLTYMHARHHSPALGRFLQPDPTAQEASAYRYAGNNPTTYEDPSGSYYYVSNWKLVRRAAYHAYVRGRISYTSYSRVYWYGLSSYARTMCYYKYRYGFSGGGSGCDGCIRAVQQGYSYGCGAGTALFCGFACMAFTAPPAIIACWVVCGVSGQVGCEISNDNTFRNQYSPLYAKRVCQDVGGCPRGAGGGF